MSNRYDLIGYCSYRDNETGKISDNFVGVLNEQNQQIDDLEAKLAESEKDRLMWQEMYKSADRQNKSICETDIYPLQEQVQQLKQQLAEKDAEVQSWKDGTIIVKLGKLEEQLAEKEKEVERAIKFIEEQEQQITDLEVQIGKRDIILSKMERKMGRLEQTAIAELEKVVEFIKEYPHEPRYWDIASYIDQQIKSLKGDADV